MYITLQPVVLFIVTTIESGYEWDIIVMEIVMC